MPPYWVGGEGNRRTGEGVTGDVLNRRGYETCGLVRVSLIENSDFIFF